MIGQLEITNTVIGPPCSVSVAKSSVSRNWPSSLLQHFFTMASCPKRIRYTAEDVLEERNEFDSNRGRMLSGEESDIDRQLMNFDELMRCV